MSGSPVSVVFCHIAVPDVAMNQDWLDITPMCLQRTEKPRYDLLDE